MWFISEKVKFRVFLHTVKLFLPFYVGIHMIIDHYHFAAMMACYRFIFIVIRREMSDLFINSLPYFIFHFYNQQSFVFREQFTKHRRRTGKH